MSNSQDEQKLIFRKIALPLRAFDYLKDLQREIWRSEGKFLNNNELLTRVLTERKQTE